MHATYQLKPDELNEKFLQAIKKQFQNKAVEIAVSDELAAEALSNEPRKAGALKGRIKMSDDFNAPLADFSEY
jgi:S-methylmethionine-dependent homocysteine/selenocysteine methylase